MKFFTRIGKRGKRPYEVGKFVHIPGAVPYFFDIVLKPEALQRVGILSKILKTIVSELAPVLHLKVSTPMPGQAIRVLLAADLKGGEKMAKRIAKAVKEVPGVEDVEYSPPLFNGVALDMWSYPPTFSGDRVIIMRKGLYESMLKEGWKRLGGSFAALLYYAYFHAGQDIYLKFYSKYAQKSGNSITLAEELFRLFGYGILELTKLTDSEALVKVYDSFECSLFEGEGEPRGAIVRGLLAGWTAGYWGASYDEILVKEEKCLAKGDPYCQYHIYRI